MANRISMRPSQLFDTFFDDFFTGTTGAISRAISSGVEVDMYDDEDNVYLDIKTSGIEQKDVNVEINEGKYVHISGEVKEENEEVDKKKNYYMREIKRESFSRTVSLPCPVDGDKAKAETKGGMIKLTLPKLPELKPKKVTIKPTA